MCTCWLRPYSPCSSSWATFVPHSSAGGSLVLVDAVLYDGFEASDADEAVRLINVSGTTVDLSGWRLNDALDSSFLTLPGGTVLAPGDTLRLAWQGTAFKRQFGYWPDYEALDTAPGVPQLTGTWPGYANTDDEVFLLDGASNVMDLLVYEGGTVQTGWSGTAVYPYTVSSVFGAEGQILYRLRHQTSGQPVPDTGTAADWAQSTGDVVNGRQQFPLLD